MNYAADLARLAREAEYLERFLKEQTESGPDVESLIDRYLDFRQVSAETLRAITDEYMRREHWALDEIVEGLESELRARLGSVIPLEFIRLRRYGPTHRKLFEYLLLHRGRTVSSSRLRALTGDQVHTERRVRELRDMGLQIEAARRSGENVYELTSEVPDIDTAVARFAPALISAVRGWSPARRAMALEQLGLA